MCCDYFSGGLVYTRFVCASNRGEELEGESLEVLD